MGPRSHLHPKPAAGLGELTPFPKVFPILLRSVPPCSPTSAGPYGQHCPPARVGGGGGGWGGSSAAQIWCFRAPDQSRLELQPICKTTGGKYKIQQLVQNPKLLKGRVGLVGCPGAGAWRWVGEAVAGLSRRTG